MNLKNNTKNLYLLADSQILFWKSEGKSFISSLQEDLQVARNTITKAAYIGASNGDNPEFFTLFTAAMDDIGIHESRMISSSFTREDRLFLEASHMILLAGGDFAQGWEIIKTSGMAEIIVNKYYSGCTLVGISAGALQLGMGGFDNQNPGVFIDTLKLVPYYVDAHDESNEWDRLKRTIAAKEEYSKGFGIPAGGGMVVYPDATIEALRNAIYEFYRSHSEKSVSTNILLPLAENVARQTQ